MTETLKQTIKEELAQLPKDRQDAISAVDWLKISEEIGKKFQLEENETNALQLETLLVLIDVVDPEFYAINIENHANTIKSEAKKIADEVMQKIFAPIGNIIIENIKKSGKHKNANAEQNLDFILSGGDYSAFAAPARVDIPPPLDKGRNEEGSLISDPHPISPLSRGRGIDINTPACQLAGRPQEGNKPKKLDDIKNKFTI